MATTKAPRKEKEQIKRPDLKIGIKDFGPIAEGEIELKPLTVFIGPNNSGKSYAAILIRSIFETHAVRFSWHEQFPLVLAEKLLPMDDNLQEMISDLESKVDALKQGEILQIPNDIVDELVKAGFRGIYESRFGRKITDSYSCNLKDLATFGKKSFSVSINFNSYEFQLKYQEGKLGIKGFPKLNEKSDLRIKIERQVGNKEQTDAWIISDGYVMTGASWTGKSFPYVFTNALSLAIPSRMLDSVMIPCHYIPSARSDKLQFYRLIVGNIFRRATSFGREKQQTIPELLGVVSDFISSIIEISPEEKGHYYQFAEELEKDLLRGSIVFKSQDADILPEAKYRFQGVDIPLQRASSSVTEIAPLILYLKYIVQPGSVLIIEEPEAHLHPGNIRILAKYLVRLVKKGVNVLITTHSEYLLEQLDNFVMLTNIDPEERVERYGYEKDDFIKHTDFAVYEFHYDQNTGTSKIEKARLTKKDGVSQDEFVKVFEELYEETGKLRRDLSDE